MDFPGGPVVKTSPSNAGGAGLISSQGAKISHALQPKNQNVNNRSNGVTNSIKTLKTIHIKKKKTLKIYVLDKLHSDMGYGGCEP